MLNPGSAFCRELIGVILGRDWKPRRCLLKYATVTDVAFELLTGTNKSPLFQPLSSEIGVRTLT